jgi:hypothetical protein
MPSAVALFVFVHMNPWLNNRRSFEKFEVRVGIGVPGSLTQARLVKPAFLR